MSQILEVKLIAYLVNEKFYVADYQRRYLWYEAQVLFSTYIICDLETKTVVRLK